METRTVSGADDGRIVSWMRMRSLLRQVPLLAGLDDAALDRMVAAGRTIQISAGQALFHDGDGGDAMFVILSGRIRILKDERLIATRSRNHFIGEMAIIDGEPRSASAIAATPVRLFRVDRKAFHELVLTSREAVLALLSSVTDAMRRSHATELALVGELQRKQRELERFNSRLEKRVKTQTRALRRINRELEALSMRDGLTGIYNRRVFNEMLVHVLEQREDRQTSLIMLDVDHFKKLNDGHGHQGGDRVLIEVARLMEKELGGGQVLARYGGEEFAIISPGGRRRAAARAEAIRAAVESHHFPLRDTVAGAVTISLGVACHPHDGKGPAALVAAADAALYRAKAEGRNRVVVHALNGGGGHG